jgi:hypothetical protein
MAAQSFTQFNNNSYFGNTDYLSFVGLQNGNNTPSSQAGFSSPSDSAPSSWNQLEEIQLSPEMFMDFDSSSFDGDEETTSVVSSLHKASKKISKASPKSDAQTSQRRTKRARNPWTPKEDQKLMELMKKYGQSWAMISSVMEGRTGKQVRDRYLNKLRPNIKCGDWSAEEDERLISLLRTVGNRWSLIATHLPGRTEGQVKNRFYSCIKKRLSGSQSQTISFTTSPQVDEQLSFDFNQEFDTNMFNTCVSDQSTAQSPNSQAMTDPTDVISYDFFSQMPARTYSYGLGPITHDSQIDGMLNKVTDYYVEKTNTNNFSLDVDSFFSDDLKVAPVVSMEEDTERYEQLSRRKAYLELALANTINEIQGL